MLGRLYIKNEKKQEMIMIKKARNDYDVSCWSHMPSGSSNEITLTNDQGSSNEKVDGERKGCAAVGESRSKDVAKSDNFG